MTELKTLKDLIFFQSSEKQFWEKDKLLNKNTKEILKQEAIKWVKFIRKPYEKSNSVIVANSYPGGQIDFIKYFFNLTEADLK